jgi:hypothetical protein
MSLTRVRETSQRKSRDHVRSASRRAPVRHHASIDTDPGTVLQRASSCVCDGGCPRCSGDGVVQAKLKISQPNDRYEQEADRVADQVMRMSEPTVQRKPG